MPSSNPSKPAAARPVRSEKPLITGWIAVTVGKRGKHLPSIYVDGCMTLHTKKKSCIEEIEGSFNTGEVIPLKVVIYAD